MRLRRAHDGIALPRPGAHQVIEAIHQRLAGKDPDELRSLRDVRPRAEHVLDYSDDRGRMTFAVVHRLSERVLFREQVIGGLLREDDLGH